LILTYPVDIEERVIINAKIYKWTFVPPDDMDHPLSGICYIGQTIQSLKDRTQKHKNDARRDGKDLGLHALYVEHPDFWTIEIVDQQTFTGPQLDARAEASEWMDDREKALIKEHGGKLKDMGRKLKQTLNLTDGGQGGDPKKYWQSIEAKTRKHWQELKPLFDAFYEEHGHVNVSQADKKNKKLGTVVNNIRWRKYYVTVCREIKTYLDEKNFIWNVREERANIIKTLILSYDNPNKKQTFVDKDLPPALAERWKMVRGDSEKDDEINIGVQLRRIRTSHERPCRLITHDPMFRAQLLENGFVMNVDEERANIIKALILSLKNPNKPRSYIHELDPKSDLAKRWNMVTRDSEKDDEIKIGRIINDIRWNGVFINNDPMFRAQLLENGFVMNPKEEHANIIKELMLSYANPNKIRAYVETNLPPALAKRWNMARRDSEKDNKINIGRIINDIRSHGQFINNDPNFFEELIAKKFKMHCTDTKKNQERIAEIRELHRSMRINQESSRGIPARGV